MKPAIQVIAIIVSVLFFFCVSCTKDPSSSNHPPTDTSSARDTTLFNVSYGSHARQVYDLYLPANRDTNTPVILMIHGGAWKAGQKEDFNPYVSLIKTQWKDVAIANMNYRLASNANKIHHNEIMADIHSVITHLMAKKSTYHISSRFGITGASAGGQLAMIYAYKYNSDIKAVGNIFGPSIISDGNWYNSNNIWLGGYVGDILSEYVGQPWDSTAYKAVSPYWNVSNKTQPTIIFHGSLDPIVPVYQSQWLHGKLNALGVTNQYHEYIALHGFDNNQSVDVINKMVAFFKQHVR